MDEQNAKRSKTCNKCGYNRDDERSRAFAEIKRLQKSIFDLGVSNNLMNMEMFKVKDENLILKDENLILKNEIKMLKLNQKNPNVQGGRKKKRKSKRRLKVRKTNKRRKK